VDLPAHRAGRTGDGLHQAVEDGLGDPRHIARIGLEELFLDTRQLRALRHPLRAARLLHVHATHPLAQALATLVDTTGGTLDGGTDSAAVLAARLSNLTVCMGVLEGRGVGGDRLLAAGLDDQAWPRATAAAAKCPGMVRAPDLFEDLAGTPAADGVLHPDPAPSDFALGLLAGTHPPAPGLNFCQPRRPTGVMTETDPDLAAAQNAIRAAVGEAPAPPARLRKDDLRNQLASAQSLLDSLGRTQVEVTALAHAAHRVHPTAALGPILNQMDDVLRLFARSLVSTGNQVIGVRGSTWSEAMPTLQAAHGSLQQVRTGLQALRAWMHQATALLLEGEAAVPSPPQTPMDGEATAVLVALGKGGAPARMVAARTELGELVARAEAEGHTLPLLFLGTIHMAHLLAAEDWEGSAQLAQTLQAAAHLRQNHLALADATLSLAAAAEGRGDLSAALDALWIPLATGQLPPAGANLLQARLLELRHKLGPDTFDPLFATAAARG